MSYTVIRAFTDLQDSNHVYFVGDRFPHDNRLIPADRMKELLGSANKIGAPLIQGETDDFSKNMVLKEESISLSGVPRGEKKYTKTEINRLSTAELREVAVEIGIDDAENFTGGELKKILVEKFRL